MEGKSSFAKATEDKRFFDMLERGLIRDYSRK